MVWRKSRRIDRGNTASARPIQRNTSVAVAQIRLLLYADCVCGLPPHIDGQSFFAYDHQLAQSPAPSPALRPHLSTPMCEAACCGEQPFGRLVRTCCLLLMLSC